MALQKAPSKQKPAVAKAALKGKPAKGKATKAMPSTAKPKQKDTKLTLKAPNGKKDVGTVKDQAKKAKVHEKPPKVKSAASASTSKPAAPKETSQKRSAPAVTPPAKRVFQKSPDVPSSSASDATTSKYQAAKAKAEEALRTNKDLQAALNKAAKEAKDRALRDAAGVDEFLDEIHDGAVAEDGVVTWPGQKPKASEEKDADEAEEEEADEDDEESNDEEDGSEPSVADEPEEDEQSSEEKSEMEDDEDEEGSGLEEEEEEMGNGEDEDKEEEKEEEKAEEGAKENKLATAVQETQALASKLRNGEERNSALAYNSVWKLTVFKRELGPYSD